MQDSVLHTLNIGLQNIILYKLFIVDVARCVQPSDEKKKKKKKKII